MASTVSSTTPARRDDPLTLVEANMNGPPAHPWSLERLYASHYGRPGDAQEQAAGGSSTAGHPRSLSRAAQGKHRYRRQNVTMPKSRASTARMASAPVRAFSPPLVEAMPAATSPHAIPASKHHSKVAIWRWRAARDDLRRSHSGRRGASRRRCSRAASGRLQQRALQVPTKCVQTSAQSTAPFPLMAACPAFVTSALFLVPTEREGTLFLTLLACPHQVCSLRSDQRAAHAWERSFESGQAVEGTGKEETACTAYGYRKSGPPPDPASQRWGDPMTWRFPGGQRIVKRRRLGQQPLWLPWGIDGEASAC